MKKKLHALKVGQKPGLWDAREYVYLPLIFSFAFVILIGEANRNIGHLFHPIFTNQIFMFVFKCLIIAIPAFIAWLLYVRSNLYKSEEITAKEYETVIEIIKDSPEINENYEIGDKLSNDEYCAILSIKDQIDEKELAAVELQEKDVQKRLLQEII